MLRVFDCFVYCGEADILEWRLTELADVADVFVIVESSRGFSGEPKPLTFLAQTERFRPWLGRIRYVVVEDMPANRVGTRGMFDRENLQRRRILDGLTDATATDLVMVSDVDEIPRADVVARYRRWYEDKHPAPTNPLTTRAFPMAAHSYWLDLRVKDWEPWWGTRITTAAMVRKLGPQAVRLARPIAEGGRTRPVEFDGPFAGWHFSSFGGPAAMADKLRLWSHCEPHYARFAEPEHLARCMAEGRDWDEVRNVPMRWTPITAGSVPRAVWADLGRWCGHIGQPNAAVFPGSERAPIPATT